MKNGTITFYCKGKHASINFKALLMSKAAIPTSDGWKDGDSISFTCDQVGRDSELLPSILFGKNEFITIGDPSDPHEVNIKIDGSKEFFNFRTLAIRTDNYPRVWFLGHDHAYPETT